MNINFSMAYKFHHNIFFVTFFLLLNLLNLSFNSYSYINFYHSVDRKKF